MSTSKDDPQQKGFTCDRIETASNVDDMPGHNLIEAERQLPVFDNAKKHWRVLLVGEFPIMHVYAFAYNYPACVSFSAATLYGFDMIINGASISMPSFMLYFGEMGPDGPYLPSIWTSLWTAMASLTQAVGSILVGTISDKYGRKWPACCASIVTMVGTAVQFTAHSRGALMGGKMIAGFGIGASLAMGITYLAEVRLDRFIQNVGLLLIETDLASEAASAAAIVFDHLHRHYPGFSSWCGQDFGTGREGASIPDCHRHPMGRWRSSVRCLDHCSGVSLNCVSLFIGKG
jgi:MFS family permease